MKQTILLDLAILLITILDPASGHVVNYTAPYKSVSPIPTGTGSQIQARHEGLHPSNNVTEPPIPTGSPTRARHEAPYPFSNSTEPPSPTGTAGPLRWIRRQLPVSTGIPEHGRYQNSTAPQAINETRIPDKA
ncbi:MAG: hypothetical protein L6R41_007363, partial [Letrouitia leprolyta]